MSAQMAIIHETDVLSHFGLQNSMVHEFLSEDYFQKYFTKY